MVALALVARVQVLMALMIIYIALLDQQTLVQGEAVAEQQVEMLA
jgi:hypothetical protein